MISNPNERILLALQRGRSQPLSQYSQLEAAVIAGDATKVATLLTEQPDFISSGRALSLAITHFKKSHYEVLETVFKFKPDINKPAMTGITAIEDAVRMLDVDLCEYLIRKGANPLLHSHSSRDNLIGSCLHPCNAYHTRGLEIIAMIDYLFAKLVKAGVSLESLEKSKRLAEKFQVFNLYRTEIQLINVWPVRYANLKDSMDAILLAAANEVKESPAETVIEEAKTIQQVAPASSQTQQASASTESKEQLEDRQPIPLKDSKPVFSLSQALLFAGSGSQEAYFRLTEPEPYSDQDHDFELVEYTDDDKDKEYESDGFRFTG